MSYKTILVHVDESQHAAARIACAAGLAINADAHLIGAATTGMSPRMFGSIAFTTNPVDLDQLSDMLREQADRSLDQFEESVRRLGVASFERRLIEGDTPAAFARQARYCDLAIVTQSDPQDTASGVSTGFPEMVALDAGCPVLILPFVHDYAEVGEHILVAWNASVEARRAVYHALPLLQRARVVHVVVFNAKAQPEVFGDDPGADLALYLARHGVKVEVLQRDVKADRGNALVALSDELDVDLIVMGCYGHARLREVILGGTTRTVLRSMTSPILMAH